EPELHCHLAETGCVNGFLWILVGWSKLWPDEPERSRRGADAAGWHRFGHGAAPHVRFLRVGTWSPVPSAGATCRRLRLTALFALSRPRHGCDPSSLDFCDHAPSCRGRDAPLYPSLDIGVVCAGRYRREWRAPSACIVRETPSTPCSIGSSPPTSTRSCVPRPRRARVPACRSSSSASSETSCSVASSKRGLRASAARTARASFWCRSPVRVEGSARAAATGA